MNSRKLIWVVMMVLVVGSLACAGGAAPTVAPTLTPAPPPTNTPPAPTPEPATDVPQPTADSSATGGKKDVGEDVTVGGLYNVEGTNPDGTTYTGTMDISGQGSVADVYWIFGGGAEVAGTAIWVQDSLIVAYPAENCILSIYLVSEDGNALEGYWVAPDTYEILTETATVTEWDEASGVLSFDIAGSNPDGSTYTGAMALTRSAGADVYSVAQVSGETTFLGSGIESGEFFAVSYGVDSGCGIAQYLVDGNTLSGTWGDLSVSDQYGYETATK